jgi:uncharacterized protein YkwD
MAGLSGFKILKTCPSTTPRAIMMKKIFYISCLILGVFSEGSSFAVQKPCMVRAKTKPTLESPAVSEQKCIAEINLVRQQHGLPPLKEWKELSDCAREHSQNMAAERCPFGHDGFKKRADKMMNLANLSSFAENVAYSQYYDDPVKIAVDGWMKSPGHRENILGDFEETGMGVAITNEGKFYITQLFAKRFKSR